MISEAYPSKSPHEHKTLFSLLASATRPNTRRQWKCPAVLGSYSSTPRVPKTLSLCLIYAVRYETNARKATKSSARRAKTSESSQSKSPHEQPQLCVVGDTGLKNGRLRCRHGTGGAGGGAVWGTAVQIWLLSSGNRVSCVCLCLCVWHLRLVNCAHFIVKCTQKAYLKLIYVKKMYN